MADRGSMKLGQGVFKLVFVLDLGNKKKSQMAFTFGLKNLNSAMSFTLVIKKIRFL